MGWAKLDDRFPTHPKVLGLSDRGFRSHVSALCYCAQHETDGLVPAAVARSLAPRRIVGELVAAGLWERLEAGYRIHDFLDYNPSRAESEARREQRRAAGRSSATRRYRKPNESLNESLDVRYEHGHAPDPTRPHPTPNGAEGKSAEQPVEKPSWAPTETQLYLLQRLREHDPRWESVTPGALVKLQQTYGPRVLTEALGYMREELPSGIDRPYAYLASVCVRVVTEHEDVSASGSQVAEYGSGAKPDVLGVSPDAEHRGADTPTSPVPLAGAEAEAADAGDPTTWGTVPGSSGSESGHRIAPDGSGAGPPLTQREAT